MRREGMNRWPEPSESPQLNIHRLDKLAARAGVTFPLSNRRLIANWLVVKQWGRAHTYQSKLRRKDAREIVDAAFEEETGVVEWLSQEFLSAI